MDCKNCGCWIQIQREIAREAGGAFPGEYDHHIGSGRMPLPFFVWKRKARKLLTLQRQSLDSQDGDITKGIERLSRELGREIMSEAQICALCRSIDNRKKHRKE